MALSYFTLPELRALPQVSDAVTYTDARCTAAGEYIEAVIERAVGTSFVERTVTAEVHDGGTYGIVLDSSHALSITSATEDGVAVTDTLSVKGGLLYRFAAGATSPTRWARGTRNVTVTYKAGYSTTPPADVKEAALKGTRAHLLATNSNAGVDDRRTSMNTELGTIQYVIAGEDRPTGYPEVDAVIMGWKSRLDNYGFA